MGKIGNWGKVRNMSKKLEMGVKVGDAGKRLGKLRGKSFRLNRPPRTHF